MFCPGGARAVRSISSYNGPAGALGTVAGKINVLMLYINVTRYQKHFPNVKQKGIGVSKTRRQKEKKQVCMAFAYELLYSTITICARSAATTTVGTAIGEASIVMDSRSKWIRTLLLQSMV